MGQNRAGCWWDLPVGAGRVWVDHGWGFVGQGAAGWRGTGQAAAGGPSQWVSGGWVGVALWGRERHGGAVRGVQRLTSTPAHTKAWAGRSSPILWRVSSSPAQLELFSPNNSSYPFPPTGTGKTLIAKAIAGEARVPFYQMAGRWAGPAGAG